MAVDARRRRYVAGRLLTVVVLLLVLTIAAIGLALRASVTRPGGVAIVSGLEREVAVTFDAIGRPYVRAATLDDALFAEGFLHARERLWQMELLRRAGRGRLSELLGGDLLDTDRSLWRAGVPQLATRLASGSSAQVSRRVAAYVAGVNAGMDSLVVRPPEFLLLMWTPRPWTPEDVYAVGAMIAWDSANNLQNELVRLDLSAKVGAARFAAFLPDDSIPAPYPHVVPAVGATTTASVAALDSIERVGLPSAAFGSNGWAVAPSRTRSGHALLAFDSHDALSLPTLFYEVHLFFGDDRQIRGWSLPGLPGVINGYNEYVAWGFTNIGDTQDLFLLAPDSPVRRRETAIIPVRGRSPPERLTIDHTDFGPVFADRPRLALSWTGQHLGAGGLDAMFALNLANSLASLQEALGRFTVPVANVTWATRDGHIGFRTLGVLPRRRQGAGLIPLDASPDSAWAGLVPADEMPQRVDPAEGFVAAANAAVAAAGRGPLVSADNAPAYRIRRIQSVLGARRDHDPAGMQALQFDWWNTQAELLLPAMLPALDDLPAGLSLDAAGILRDWQRRPFNAPQLAAPLLFERWYLALGTKVFRDAVGADTWARVLKRNYLLNHALDRLILVDADSPWWGGERDRLVRTSFVEAVAELAVELGPDIGRWRWDARHQVVMQHELGQAVPMLSRWLNRGPYPWGGGAATVGRANYRYAAPALVNHAATMRMVADMNPSGMEVAAVLCAGQSGNPLSRHYADQTAAWLAGELSPIAARPEDVTGPQLRLRPKQP